MSFKTLISTAELASHLEDPKWVVLDCRFSLVNPVKGRRDYEQAHIPGALYADLDKDLAGPVTPGVTGRHPLPSVDQAARTFSNWGIDSGVQVVAYDDAGGALAAVRAWWMLRWLGHETVAVLDGGWQAWLAEERPVRSGWEIRPAAAFIPHPRPDLLVSAMEVDQMRRDPRCRVFDARTAARYRGENETIDPVAGHIPGALSAPYLDNLTPQGKFRPIKELRQHYQDLLGDVPAEQTAFYCGSGVTSIHDILAMKHAGLEEGRLYVGSWSEWITDPNRPVTK